MEEFDASGERYDVNVVWQPQIGPQEALVACPITLVGYGGARGGGKTDGVLGKFAVKQEQLGVDFNAIFFRKELPQADDLIERAKQIYLPLKAHYQDQKKQFTFPNGGRLRFRPLANDSDAEKYQGQNLSDCAIEEAGNYSDPSCIWKLFGALRGRGNGQIILTFNPGGVGHHWLKELFIKPAPKGMKILKKELPNGKHFEYIYIPSRVHDNQILLTRDPEYIDRLHMVGSPELVRAWLEGDFEIHEGSYFPEFSSRHIVSPFNIPKHWPRYLGFDWGYRSPFAAIWGAVSSGRDDKGNEVPYPKGSIVIYRELWGKGVDNKEQANRIASLSVGENPIAVADPSIFSEEGGPSINDQFNSVFMRYNHPSFRRADNDRISGWSQIRQRLVAKPALLYIFSSCPYLLETLPSLAIDKRNAEDADTSGNDHACLTGNTLVVTDLGIRPIKDLCTGSLVRVLSHDGKFYDARGALTKEQARVITLTFSDNSKVTCTPDHQFRLPDGSFKLACLLNVDDAIDCVTYESNSYFRDVPRVRWSPLLPLREILFLAREARSWFEKATQKSVGILQRLNPKRDAHPPHRRKQNQQPDRKPSASRFKNAFAASYDRRENCSFYQEFARKSCAFGKVLAQKFAGQRVAFATCYRDSQEHAVYLQDLQLLREGIPNQEAHGEEKSVLPSKLQNERTTKTVKSLSYAQATQDVYCLIVPKTSTFVLANGIVSHNCDALRYLCKARLLDAKWEQPAEVLNKGVIKLQAYIEKMRKHQRRPQI